MSRFKGTKGKWSVDYSTYIKGQGYIPIKSNIDNRDWIIEAKGSHINNGLTKEEQKANALLISKAPEMLEMLEKVVNYYHIYESDVLDEAKKLIKEATDV